MQPKAVDLGYFKLCILTAGANNINLKYQRFTRLVCEYMGTRKWIGVCGKDLIPLI